MARNDAASFEIFVRVVASSCLFISGIHNADIHSLKYRVENCSVDRTHQVSNGIVAKGSDSSPPFKMLPRIDRSFFQEFVQRVPPRSKLGIAGTVPRAPTKENNS